MRCFKLVLGVAVVVVVSMASAAVAGAATERVSVSSAGVQGDDRSLDPSVSADGRFVAFTSDASTLVPNDTNGRQDVFVHDRWAGTTRRVSVSSAGVEGNGDSSLAAMSADGRFVMFTSDASNLVPNDTNAAVDVFVRDLRADTTRRVSVSTSGDQGNGDSLDPFGTSISTDGRFVAFTSDASNLVPRDTNATVDVFVRDRSTHTTRRVSVGSAGVQGNDASLSPSISADGRFVAFSSFASNLVPNFQDANGPFAGDVFVRDRSTHTTRRVSVSSAGAPGDAHSSRASISADGRFVAFQSDASNLVPNDTNETRDVFVRDRSTHTTRRVSVSSAGVQGNNFSQSASISADGRFVAFTSFASNLVAINAPFGEEDVFVRDRSTHTTRRVSVSSAGVQGDNLSGGASISADGRFVAFQSDASNLVPNDTNGLEDVFVRGPLR